MAIQFRRGTQAQWDANNSNIVAGEPVITTDTGNVYVGTAPGEYVELGKASDITDLETQVSDVEDDVADINSHLGTVDDALYNLASTKVNKETGKGLSTQDFTTAYMQKLNGIEAGAEVNPDPSSTVPLMDGTGAVGSSEDYARADHVHPSDTSKASQSDMTSAQSAISALQSGLGTAQQIMVYFDSEGYLCFQSLSQ